MYKPVRRHPVEDVSAFAFYGFKNLSTIIAGDVTHNSVFAFN